jgi:hypothetical protein
MLADDSTVRYLDRSMIVQCRSVPYIDRIRQFRRIVRVLQQLMIVQSRYCSVQSSAGAGTISWLTIQSTLFAGFFLLDGQV